jgi:large subunit ribosomal protein L17
MRHRKAGVKLNRTTSHRQAMFKNMVTSLFKHDRIRTTDVKAKELRRWADHIITLAKRGDLHARRQVMAIVQEKDVVHKLFENAEKRFGAKNGGYTRIIKIGRRPGDAAPVSLIELIAAEPKAKPKKKAKRVAKKKEAAAAPAPAETSEAAAEEQVASAPQPEEKSPAPKAEAQPETTAEADADAQSAAEPVEAAAADEAQAAPAAGEAGEDAEPSAEEKDQDAEEPDKK